MTPEQAADRPANSTEIILVNGNGTLPDYALYTHRCASQISYMCCMSSCLNRGIHQQSCVRDARQLRRAPH